MKTTRKSTLTVKTAVRAGGMNLNHARSGLKVRAAVRAGGMNLNHARPSLRVKSAVRAGLGPVAANHSRRALSI
jgi:hypothetical protein